LHSLQKKIRGRLWFIVSVVYRLYSCMMCFAVRAGRVQWLCLTLNLSVKLCSLLRASSRLACWPESSSLCIRCAKNCSQSRSETHNICLLLIRVVTGVLYASPFSVLLTPCMQCHDTRGISAYVVRLSVCLSVCQSINQLKHICIAPYVANESEAHGVTLTQ